MYAPAITILTITTTKIGVNDEFPPLVVAIGFSVGMVWFGDIIGQEAGLLTIMPFTHWYCSTFVVFTRVCLGCTGAAHTLVVEFHVPPEFMQEASADDDLKMHAPEEVS